MKINFESSTGSGERQLDWVPDAWFTGTPDQRCRYCGLPVLFAPGSLGLESCGCDRSPQVDAPVCCAAGTITVKFARPVRFNVLLGNPNRVNGRLGASPRTIFISGTRPDRRLMTTNTGANKQ